MIVYVVSLYELPSQRIGNFIRNFRDRCQSMSKTPGYIHTELLEELTRSPFLCRFLSVCSFTSLEAVNVAERSTEMQRFLRWASSETTLSVKLRAFSFLRWPGSENNRNQEEIRREQARNLKFVPVTIEEIETAAIGSRCSGPARP